MSVITEIIQDGYMFHQDEVWKTWNEPNSAFDLQLVINAVNYNNSLVLNPSLTGKVFSVRLTDMFSYFSYHPFGLTDNCMDLPFDFVWNDNTVTKGYADYYRRMYLYALDNGYEPYLVLYENKVNNIGVRKINKPIYSTIVRGSNYLAQLTKILNYTGLTKSVYPYERNNYLMPNSLGGSLIIKHNGIGEPEPWEDILFTYCNPKGGFSPFTESYSLYGRQTQMTDIQGHIYFIGFDVVRLTEQEVWIVPKYKVYWLYKNDYDDPFLKKCCLAECFGITN